MDPENTRGVRRGSILPEIRRGSETDHYHYVPPFENGRASVPMSWVLHTSGDGGMQANNAQYFPDFQSFPDSLLRPEWALPSLTDFSTQSSTLLGVSDLGLITNEDVPQQRVEIEQEANKPPPTVHNDPFQVCFGQIENIPVRRTSRRTSNTIPVNLGDNRVILDNHGSKVGNIDQEMAGVLRVLSSEPEVRLQLSCFSRRARATSKKESSTDGDHITCIIYGPMAMFEDIGNFLQDNGLYLQDPKRCDRNVRYRNPHRLYGLDDDAPMMMDLEKPYKSPTMEPLAEEILQVPKDIFSDFETTASLPETVTPGCLATELYGHQKQALTFMLSRENGWALSGETQDIWRESHDEKGQKFVNSITGEAQRSSPVQFHGGLLADPMGLGKTLSIIALISCDQSSMTKMKITRASSYDTLASQRKATLLIAPSTLLNMWNMQLVRHLKPGALRWITHHGQKRITNIMQIDQYDVVLTSYQTMTSEWKKRESSASPIFLYNWHRIALDEGHQIRNNNTVAAKAIYSLQSWSKWVITGTPIQNRLSDISSLLLFLRPYPYDNLAKFEADIIEPWKSGNEEVAIQRLKALFTAIALRRSKSVVELPPRVDIKRRLDFSRAEFTQYREAEAAVATMLDDAIRTQTYTPSLYANALQRINRLRMICNLGAFAKLSKEDMGNISSIDHWNTEIAQGYFNDLVTVGSARCWDCGADIGSVSQDEGDESGGRSGEGRLLKCMVLLCGTCFQKIGKQRGSRCYSCGSLPPCPSAAVSASRSFSETLPYASDTSGHVELPTKVKTVVEDVKNLPKDTKSVIFSFWTSTLDVTEHALRMASILYTRVDGKMQTKRRIAAFEQFRIDKRVKVLLLSLSCGAVGIDLTSASRAYLMEPHWNPHVEEQALARIHRMGQVGQVTTIRFVMNSSFEDHMLKVQDRKAHLAGLLLSQKKVSQSAVNMSRIHHLRSLLS